MSSERDFKEFKKLLIKVWIKMKQNRVIKIKATCFTKQIGIGVDYSGEFPCSRFSCPGCSHNLQLLWWEDTNEFRGFPFELTEQIDSGGFARFYKGKFHQGHAMFKFITCKEDDYKYNTSEIGCYEYNQQEIDFKVVCKRYTFIKSLTEIL